VSLSLASVTEGGSYLDVDMSLYDPLDQSLVLCNTKDGAEADAAKQFSDFLASKGGPRGDESDTASRCPTRFRSRP